MNFILIFSLLIFEFGCFASPKSLLELEQCGHRLVVGGLIAGGNETKPGDWPWLVALMLNPSFDFFCAGSLISSKHVLSAAHCFNEKGPSELLDSQNVTVVVGKHDLNLPNEFGSTNHSVLEIILHRDWDINSTSYDADIAILFLFNSVTFTERVQPICLPEPSIEENLGSGTVAGWGYSSSHSSVVEQFPRKIKVPVISSAQCYHRFPLLAKLGSERTFCGGFDNRGMSPCAGDSGGGLYERRSTSWSILGIVSSALTNQDLTCETNKYTIYTNVAKLVYWIKNVIADGKLIINKYVEFECSLGIGFNFDTSCRYDDDKEFSRDLRIHPDFSKHVLKSPRDVKNLELDVAYSHHMFLGLGEAFSNLKSLKMFGFLTTLERRHFSFLGKLKTLVLTKVSWLNGVADDVFWELWKLEELEISESSLMSLPPDIFITLKSLRKLTLKDNKLRSIDKEIFSKTSQLEVLSIRENLSLNVENTPYELPNLKTFELSDCGIKEIPESFFSKMENLENIDLGHNELGPLSRNLFKNLRKLKNLDLRYNPMKVLTPGILSDLTALETLNINNCSLVTFSGLLELKNIFADRNQLKVLEKGHFDDNTKLENLDFDYNELKTINIDFTKFDYIQTFEFRYNQCVDVKYSKNHKEDNIYLHGSIIILNCTNTLENSKDIYGIFGKIGAGPVLDVLKNLSRLMKPPGNGTRAGY